MSDATDPRPDPADRPGRAEHPNPAERPDQSGDDPGDDREPAIEEVVERASIADAVGGPLGVAESVLPPITFVTAYTMLGSDPAPAAWIAVGVGAVAALARIVRGQTLQYALAGLFGVGLAAFIVSRTGRAEDFFVPGLLANAAYALGCGISIAARYPAVGLAIGSLRGDLTGWRSDALRLRAYTRATWVWVGIFTVRLAVQLPLYLAGAVVALGTARVAMGFPIFALGVWVSWLILRTYEPDLFKRRRTSDS